MLPKLLELNIIIVDETKKVQTLGEKNQSVPIEVLPFALTPVKQKLKMMGAKPVAREAKGKLGPLITDNCNIILDAEFGLIPNPQELDQKLHMITGVVETGLFYGITDLVFVASAKGIEKLSKK